jgi:preprotein translocase subunit SecD
MRAVLAIFGAMISAGATFSESLAQGTGAPREAVAIEFRLAEDAPGPGLTEAEVAGERAYLHSRVELSNEHLAHVERMVSDAGLVLNLWFTQAGGDRLTSLTAANIGRRLAVLINARLVSAPAIVDTLHPTPEQPVTLAVQLPPKEADQLARSIAQAWPSKKGH